MTHRYPSLADFINTILSLIDLRQWAEENYLTDDPFIQQRMRRFLVDILPTFIDADSLIVWAIENLLLTNQLVRDRLADLQTCKQCSIEFDLSSELWSLLQTNINSLDIVLQKIQNWSN